MTEREIVESIINKKNIPKTVHVLGTEYSIEYVKISECEKLKNNHWCGLCSNTSHIILIGDTSEEEFFGVMSEEEQKIQTKRILRHEIIHAFLNESGLQDDSSNIDCGWAVNEEMVDWIAIQFPKMVKAFEEADCL